MKNTLHILRKLVTNRLCLGLWGVFSTIAAYSQTVMIPTANTNTGSQRFPLGNWWGFERSSAIYTAAEIGLAGSIDSIGWYVNSLASPAASTPTMIYMKLVPASSYSASTTVAADTTGATLVYNGSVLSSQLIVNAWTMLKLQTSFTFPGGANNLQVTVLNSGGGTGIEGQFAKQFRYHTAPTNTHQSWTGDNTAPGGTGTLATSRPNVQLFVATTPMSYTSSDVATALPVAVPKGAVNAPVVSLNVVTAGYSSPLSFTSINVSTAGTTSLANISNLKVYYTGASNAFSTANQFGSTVATPAASQTITGSVNLGNGNNYFWVTYDVSATAATNNVIDAAIPTFTVSAVPYTPTTTAPAGNRVITAPLSGNYNVGVGQTYTTITAAVTDLNVLGVSGPVNFFLTNPLYNTALGEVFPITVNRITGATPVNKITMSPAAGNTALVEDSATNLFTLNGTKYFTFNGQQGGTGTAKKLTIKNKHVSGSAVTLVNDAVSNKLINSIFLGAANTAATIGVINLNGGVVTGNDSNAIDNCDIGGDTITSPVTLIQSAGSTDGDSVKYNDYNSVTNCNLFNFWHASSEANAFKLSNGTNYWTITGNSIYQTSISGRTSSGGYYTFNFQNSSNLKALNGNRISNNYIGGSAPQCAGTPWKQNSSAATMITYFNLGNQSTTRFSNNTIANIDMVTTSTATGGGGTWNAVQFVNGMMEIDSNLIGSMTDSNSIVIRMGSAGVALPISVGASSTAGVYSISSNKLGGIKINGGGTTSNNLTLINIVSAVSSMTFNIKNNILGNSGPNNIIAWPSSSTTSQTIRGINNTSSANLIIANNIIHNFTNMYSSTGTGMVIGIASSSGRDTISSNLIDSLSSTTSQTGSGSSSSVIGISYTSTTNGSLISQNTIYALSNQHPTAAVKVTGIHYSGGTDDIVSRNIIHSFSTASTSVTSQQVGIGFAGGTARIHNNIVRLGIDMAGASQTVTPGIAGILKSGGNIRAFYNSVYIGGNNVGTALAQTFAFSKTSSGTDSVFNNVFANERLNASTGGGHFAIGLNNNTTYTAGYNLYWSTGVGDTLALFNNIGKLSIAELQGLTGSDLSSGLGDPKFIQPTGSFSSLNMQISTSLATPVEGSGTVIPGITTDYYGSTRTNDIGAQSGTFIAADVFAPVITTLALGHTASTADRTLTVNITDQTGIPTISNRPVVYYKKMAAGTFVSASGNRTSGTAKQGTWSFTLSATALGGLTTGDSVYYYVVAQDSSAGTYLSSSPAGAIASNVASVTTTPATYFSYKILPGIAGATYTVGTSATYPTLTGAGGAFEALNSGIITGNIVLSITSDIVEPGTNGLNELLESGTGNYKVSIVPDMATVRNITGSVGSTGLLRLNGADRVTIDGSFAGSGQYLRFMNRSTAANTIVLLNDAHLDTVKNCIIEGVASTGGTILFGTTNKAGGTGNDSNAIINCMVRDTLGTLAAGNIPNTGINNTGTGTTGLENNNNAIIGNEIFNFNNNAINLTSTGTGDNWTISDNKIYRVINKTAEIRIIQLAGGANHLVNNNSIGGANTTRGGAAITTSGLFSGIYLLTNVNNVKVTGNQISNMYSSGTSTTVLSSAIDVAAGSHKIGGPNVADRNTIGTLTDSLTSTNSICGMILNSSGTIKVENNLIQGIVYQDADFERAVGIYIIAGNADTILNNEVRNIRHYSNSASGALNTTFAPAGIFVNGGTNHFVKSNLIHDLGSFPTTTPYPICGIKHATSTGTVVDGNRVYNLTNTGAGAGTNGAIIVGIHVSSGDALFSNNQVTVGDERLNDALVFGIRDDGTGTTNYRNNSVLVTGHGKGANLSAGMYRNAASVFSAVNNLVYVNRINDSIGIGFAVGSTLAVSNANFNHNMLICADTAILATIGGGSFGWNAFNGLYTAGPNTNWAEKSINVSATNLFTNTINGDLGIVAANSEAWYVNGKGLPIAGMSGDYATASGVRSVTPSAGSIDIGSREVTPTSLPPIAFTDKTPVVGDSTQFFFASRMLAKVKWNSGALPSAVNLRYYSGVNPSNTPAGKTMNNAYWNFAPVGGGSYGYDLSLMVDTSVIGTVSNRPNTDMARYTGTGTVWNAFTNTTVNTVAGSMTSTGWTAVLGIVTGTDGSNNPLPVRLNSFTASVASGDVIVSWTTASEQNNRGFEVERSIDGKTFEYVGFVKGAGNSSRSLSYALTDAEAFAKAGSNVLYYRLKQVDFDNKEVYSNIIRVSSDSKEDGYVTVYPNPFVKDYSITFNSKADGTAIIKMVDIQGKTVSTLSTGVTAGTNILMMSEAADLKQGIYFVHLTLNDETHVFKLMKN